MDRLFASPELRVSVFRFLQSSDLIKCAQVCRKWKDDALYVRWRFCTVGLRELMGKLAPMEEEEGENEYGEFCVWSILQTSVAELGEDGWKDFLRLTAKVHIFSISTFLLHLDSVKLLKELLNSYGGPLFPNLRRFEIWSDSEFVPMIFLGLVPGLTSALINGMDACSSEDRFDEIFSQVSQSCGGIRHLELQTYCAQSGPVFNAFPELRSLDYWSGKFSGESWMSLARCNELTKVDLLHVQLEDIPEDLGAKSFEFPSLKELRISGTKKVETCLLLNNTRMPSLQRLQMKNIKLTEEEAKELRGNLKSLCPQLEHIELSTGALA
ncbi:hypothetical protein FRB90_004502 [Tulasnella sp. 427]|nr:hypothetical protein FRB90_004502 [Tulasnella sp. 427]